MAVFCVVIYITWYHLVSKGGVSLCAPLFHHHYHHQALNFFWKFWSSERSFFHFTRSWTQAVLFLILSWRMSCIMLSSHLCFGLPLGLMVRGVHLNIFLIVLESGILCTWPNQLSVRALTLIRYDEESYVNSNTGSI
jgi:hypothetical protein